MKKKKLIWKISKTTPILRNKIVDLIERDVNELYSRKLINQVKIDQIDTFIYSFDDYNLEKEVAFNIENNNLICINSFISLNSQ